MAETKGFTPPEPPKPQTEGWWKCPDYTGSIDAVIAKVDANKDISPHWKAAIIEDLKVLKGQGFNFVYLDVHFHIAPRDQARQQSPGKRVMHYDATPDTVAL